MQKPSKNGIETIIILAIIIIKLLKRKPRKKNIRGLKRLKGLKVYSSEGIEIGKIEEIFLENYKIHSLKIKLQKKKKFKLRGIVIKYNYVEAVRDIVIINENVLEEVKK